MNDGQRPATTSVGWAKPHIDRPDLVAAGGRCSSMPVFTKMVDGCVRSRIRVLLALFALGVTTLAILPSTAGAAGGVLRVTCNYSNSKQVDPIVSFGRATSAHMHDFYGNTGVTASSTLSSLLSTPSNCRGRAAESQRLLGADDVPTRPAGARTEARRLLLPVPRWPDRRDDPPGLEDGRRQS